MTSLSCATGDCESVVNASRAAGTLYPPAVLASGCGGRRWCCLRLLGRFGDEAMLIRWQPSWKRHGRGPGGCPPSTPGTASASRHRDQLSTASDYAPGSEPHLAATPMVRAPGNP